MAGRLPGSSKSGGRRRGSLDRAARTVITEKIAGDILGTYQKLGGAKFLLKWAEENQTEFIRNCLARLMPAFSKDDDAAVQFNQQVNIGELSPFEAARRVAFALAAGLDSIQEPAPAPLATRLPAEPDLPPLDYPAPVEDPERQQWAQELQLTGEERRDQRLVEQTLAKDYPGSATEQGLRRRELL